MPREQQVPGRAPWFVDRPRINALLDQGMNGRVTLVCAPAGWGKTAAVAVWAARVDPLHLAWLTLDATDNDPARLRAVFARAHRLADTTAPTILVLDRVDVLVTEAASKVLATLVREAPPSSRVVLCGRTEPAIPFGGLRRTADLTEIRTADLAFTPDEAATLLARFGLTLTGEEVRRLVEHTEGWAVGLCLASPDAAADGLTDRVADYFRREVIAPAPLPVRQFLLGTSIVDRMCVGLAQAITGSAEAARHLRDLTKQGLLFAEDGRWVRAHRPFREFLRREALTELPRELPRMHVRAARWWIEHGESAEAVRHALAADKWRYAAPALPAFAAAGLSAASASLAAGSAGAGSASRAAGSGGPASAAGDSSSVGAGSGSAVANSVGARSGGRHRAGAGVAVAAPPVAPPRVPTSTTSAASVSSMSAPPVAPAQTSGIGAPPRGTGGGPPGGPTGPTAGEVDRELVDAVTRLADIGTLRLRDEHTDLIRRAGDLLGRLEITVGSAEAMAQIRAITQLHAGVGQLWCGSLEAAVRSLDQGADGGRRHRLDAVVADALGHRALISAVQGRLHDAEERAAAALRTVDVGSTAAIAARLALALVSLERIDVESAETHLDQADCATRGGATGTAAIEVLRARLWQTQLDATRARAALTAASEAFGRVTPPPTLRTWLSVTAAEQYLLEDRPDAALSVVDGLLRHRQVDPIVAPARVVAARAHLSRGAPARARSLLAPLQAPAAAIGLGTWIEAWLVDALAAAQLSLPGAVCIALGHALAAAEPEGFRRPFRDRGEGLADLLARYRDVAEPYHRFVDGLDAPPSEPIRLERGLPEAITVREAVVLRYLPTLLTAHEIAGELCVSRNTVKTQLKSIYRKLDVRTRRAAVDRARHLGLLPRG